MNEHNEYSRLNRKTNAKKLKQDNYQTPDYATNIILKYIPKDWVIWDPGCGELKIISCARNMGYQAIGTDICYKWEQDFFEIKPEFHWDIIVTNPPFSLKTEFLERAASFGKPFCFLMNLSSLSTAKRQKIFQDNWLQLVLLDKRISFIVDGIQTKGAWFDTAWFTFGLNFPNDIIYEKVIK